VRKILKIILTVHQFLPDYFSGTETLTYETAKELKRQGHDVGVVTGFPSKAKLNDADRFDQYTYDGIPVERFHHMYVPMGTQSNIQELEYNNKLFGSFFENYLIREKPDIVHFFHLSRLSAIAVDICNKLGIKTVFTPTDFWFICPTFQLRLPNNQACFGPNSSSVNCLRHLVYLTQPQRINSLVQRIPDWLIRTIIYFIKHSRNIGGQYPQLVRALVDRKSFLLERMHRIDQIAIPTQVMMSLLVQNGLDVRRTTTIPFGLNLAYLEGATRPEPADVLRLGYIGTLYEHKGVHVLLEAIKNLEGKPLEVKIYGKLDDFPDYVRRLKEIVQGDTRVRFCGTFPNHELGSIFSDLDALVVPSLWYENSPLVVYSAQAAKCPIIASNVAGISQIIEHGKNGILFNPGDIVGLADAITNLLDNRDMLQKMSSNAKCPLSIQEYVFRLLNIYCGLI
jgi:glycosyltransferase involved in cell wall biosynthesis